MRLEMSLKVNDALEQRLEVIGDLGAESLPGEQRPERLPRDRAGGRDPVAVPQDLADLGLGRPAFASWTAWVTTSSGEAVTHSGFAMGYGRCEPALPLRPEWMRDTAGR